ncbi:hypothetical protein V1477_011015, partial [Vespula maculifrons]
MTINTIDVPCVAAMINNELFLPNLPSNNTVWIGYQRFTRREKPNYQMLQQSYMYQICNDIVFFLEMCVLLFSCIIEKNKLKLGQLLLTTSYVNDDDDIHI